jgi:hypothetical protein
LITDRYFNAQRTLEVIHLIRVHGVSCDFFVTGGQIHTDFHAGAKLKSSAQGLITLTTYRMGMLIGF